MRSRYGFEYYVLVAPMIIKTSWRLWRCMVEIKSSADNRYKILSDEHHCKNVECCSILKNKNLVNIFIRILTSPTIVNRHPIITYYCNGMAIAKSSIMTSIERKVGFQWEEK